MKKMSSRDKKIVSQQDTRQKLLHFIVTTKGIEDIDYIVPGRKGNVWKGYQTGNLYYSNGLVFCYYCISLIFEDFFFYVRREKKYSW